MCQVKNYENKEFQTNEGVFVSKDDYELLVHKASLYCDFKAELNKVKSYYSKSLQSPLMDPHAFEKVCNDVGAEKLYSTIFGSMCPDQISNERKHLTKIRAMVIIYIMMYSLSQKANWFQIALSRTLQQFGITERGLASLKNLGIAAHPHTVKAAARSSAASHSVNMASFIQTVTKNKHFFVLCIDDYHNTHTQSTFQKQRHKPKRFIRPQCRLKSSQMLKLFQRKKYTAYYLTIQLI